VICHIRQKHKFFARRGARLIAVVGMSFMHGGTILVLFIVLLCLQMFIKEI